MTAPTIEQKYADKIAKLLNTAEGEGPEAELAMEMAGKLMAKYAIDEQMVAAARGLTIDTLAQDTFDYTGIYRNGYQRLGGVVADHFGLKCVNGRDTGKNPVRKPLYLAGFKSDIERARLLDTSLQLQAVAAHTAWWKENKDRFAWMDKGLSFRTRRDFVFGFADGVNSKLVRARLAARAEAATTEAERADITEAAATASVSLVLVDRSERVKEYYDEVWGGKTRTVSHRYGTGLGGRDAGQAAGLNATTATTGIGGNRGAISR